MADDKKLTPPQAAANAAARGLAYRKKSGKGGLTVEQAGKQGIGSGVQRAVNLKNRDSMSPATVKRMAAFFSRHEKNKGVDPKNKGTPWKDAGHVAWLLWGGDAGRRWAESVKRRLDAKGKK